VLDAGVASRKGRSAGSVTVRMIVEAPITQSNA
jgi:hypothetical protein